MGGVLSSVGVDRLLEREHELTRLDEALGSLGIGAGAVVVVEGPAGIGKSELLAVARARAQQRGLEVLYARGSEFEAEIAFGVARQLFEPMMRGSTPADRRRLVSGVARVGARAIGVVGGEPPAERFAAIHGLYWLCANRAQRGGLVVMVDDLQWADDPSLAWLGYLSRRVGDLPVVIVLGLRSGDPGGDRGEVSRLVGDAEVRRIALGPLSDVAVGTMVRARLDEQADESFCVACRELTGGNPLFVRELLAAAGEERVPARGDSVPALRLIAPAAVGPSVLARLTRLGGDAVALARAVAVLGPGAEVIIAAGLSGLDPVVAELAADQLAAAQILMPARPLEFFHPLIGAAVREDIAPGARRIAHRRAAELVDDGGEESLARVAAHLLACGPTKDDRVARRLCAAAREALDRGAPEVAATYARRAVLEPPGSGDRAAVMLLLGTAEWRAGQPEAIGNLERSLAAAEKDPETLIGATLLLALGYSVTDRAERAVEVLEAALAIVGGMSVVVSTALEAGIAIIGMNNERTARAALQRAEGLRDRLGTLADPSVHVLAMLAHYAARTNRAAEAMELTDRALACEPYPPPLEICNVLIVTLALLERYEEVQRLCEDLLASARHRGAMQETIGILVCRASASCDVGALADAEADARWALERAQGVFLVQAVSEVVRVLVERDALDLADGVLEELPDPGASHSIELTRFLIARGRLRGAQGRLQEALGDLLECGRRCDQLGLATLSAASWRGEAALVLAALGDTQRARRLADEQLKLAREFNRPRTLGASLRVSGLVESQAVGLELLGEAVTTLESGQSPLELGRALADRGAMLRRAGHRLQARADLERALDLAHHLGARRIANRARSELIAAGAKPRRDAITGRDALTAGELRVARLAADGLTNREIAQALFITTKTAKAHLNRVYRKLDITRRGQLAAALSSLRDDSRADSPGGFANS